MKEKEFVEAAPETEKESKRSGFVGKLHHGIQWTKTQAAPTVANHGC